MAESTVAPDARAYVLRRALNLQYLTVGWNLVEGGVGIAAALLSGSIALLGFGVDSFVECASGLVLIWRLAAERRGMDEEAIERIDERAHKLVGASLFLLAAYIAVDAILALWRGDRPDPSLVGVALTTVSLVAMVWLAPGETPCSGCAGQPGAPGRRLPDHRLLLAVGHHARRHRAERALRLVVGGPGGRARDDLVHRAGGTGSLARGGVRMRGEASRRLSGKRDSPFLAGRGIIHLLDYAQVGGEAIQTVAQHDVRERLPVANAPSTHARLLGGAAALEG